MATPDWWSFVQVGPLVVGVLIMALGVRRGQIGRRPGGTRYMDIASVDMRLVWAGMAVWAAGNVAGLVGAVVWFSVLRIALSSVTLLLTVGIIAFVAAVHRRRRSGALDDIGDE